MSVLRKIKAKISTIETYIRSNSAMKSVASVRISKFKRKLSVLKSLTKINDAVKDIDSEIDKLIIENKKTLHILIGCNQGMCGTFLSKISNYLKLKIQKLKSNEYYYILGEKFLEYGMHSRIMTQKILCDLELSNIVYKIYDFILNEEISNIALHFLKKDKMNKEFFVMDRDIYQQHDIHEFLKLLIKVANAVYTSGFYENKERILALEQANGNAKKIRKKSYNELNRVRQDSITNDLAEIVAGVI